MKKSPAIMTGLRRSMLCLLLCSMALPVLGLEKSDLPQHISTASGELELCGAVTLRALGLIKFGYAGLYLDRCDDADELLQGSAAQQYSVLLTRDAKGEQLRDMAIDSLQDNFDATALANLQQVFNCMTSAYSNTEEGNRIDVRYLPQHGLSMLVNGELVADCGGEAKAAGYFSIWFGDDPFNASMRDKLLSQALAGVKSNKQNEKLASRS